MSLLFKNSSLLGVRPLVIDLLVIITRAYHCFLVDYSPSVGIFNEIFFENFVHVLQEKSKMSI